MISIATIVEGDGEVHALPILLRRLNQWKSPELYFNVLAPIRVRRDRFLNREDEFRKQLLLAAAKCELNGWILILLDADDDCPADLGASVLKRAQEVAPHRRVSVVLANREFESWFIAAAASLDGVRGFTAPNQLVDAETPRNAKGWIEKHMEGSYSEILDQPGFTHKLDLQQAFDGCRSFRKLCSEWDKNTM